ncbi:MAG: lipopolysaccharide core heptose(I) kinase RfaP [Planctomycetales bacterium 4572_13]|nr:MAG: lipopolysaccharide core heptose(I) kinase RfaP [Planctomycetales bacterium 4572_13]
MLRVRRRSVPNGQANRRPPDLNTAGFKQNLLGKIAEIAKKLHKNGINHRDFYLCHFLLNISGETNQTPKLYLVDLHRAQQRQRVPFRWRVKDVGGLYFSAMDIGLTRNDLFRFMRDYTGKTLRQTLAEDKRFWKAVRRRAIWTYRRDFGKNPECKI